MALVIAHAELVSDQTSDPRTAPQRRREALRLGAFQQQRLEAFELRGVCRRLLHRIRYGGPDGPY